MSNLTRFVLEEKPNRIVSSIIKAEGHVILVHAIANDNRRRGAARRTTITRGLHLEIRFRDKAVHIEAVIALLNGDLKIERHVVIGGIRILNVDLTDRKSTR